MGLIGCLGLCGGLLSLFCFDVDCLCCMVVMLLHVHCLLLHDVWFGVGWLCLIGIGGWWVCGFGWWVGVCRCLGGC